MKSKSYRRIYCVEALSTFDYDLVARRYYRNKRLAERAAKLYKYLGCYVHLRKLNKFEHRYVNHDDVEG